jgi:tRNA threonylcarbamoyladenosine modification (KEOPS) complex Cgi121 subunit
MTNYMQKRLEEYGKTVEINGFRNVCVEDAKDLSKTLKDKIPVTCDAQLFDANLVATWQHLYFAVLNAVMNLNSARGISKSIAVETLLYASAQGQISRAIDFIGLKPNSKNAAIVIVCKDAESAEAAIKPASKLLGTEPDESVLVLTKAKISHIKKAFKISEAELDASMSRGINSEQAIVDLVVERVALLSTRI